MDLWVLVRVRYFFVTFGKLETYKETIKEKSTTLLYRTVSIRYSVLVQYEYEYEFNMVDFSFIVSLYVSDLFNVTIV